MGLIFQAGFSSRHNAVLVRLISLENGCIWKKHIQLYQRSLSFYKTKASLRHSGSILLSIYLVTDTLSSHDEGSGVSTSKRCREVVFFICESVPEQGEQTIINELGSIRLPEANIDDQCHNDVVLLDDGFALNGGDKIERIKINI